MITLTNIIKYFHKGSVNEVFALDKISLHLEEGDFVTVIGSNGAGKSTLLNGIAGTFFPDSGKIEVDGMDVTHWPEYRRAALVARVFQDPLLGTCPAATIEQNLALASLRGKRRGLGRGVKTADRILFREALARLQLGLEDRMLDKVGLLSGGQRQALTMLMATAVRPKVLLLDEHIAALDPKTAGQILGLTREIVEGQKLTTLMITHNMNHAIAFGNRLVMLHQGRILLDLSGEKKAGLTVKDLLEQFYHAQGEELATDSLLLG
ncbi:ATP-binding cassette domain-containing protein [Desulforhopalus vacuolatus]|uniref:ABC transporter ATP-binding protein n=1 Tax=Desulforhopalus vacuolatus TaxID=40414 RepID=UPI0019647696|nr:ATP-binding cassette domain-containing protein [Desulforhopalus vacuolatus]MBM9518225.1 ATP-binding cassette domain-containing protein [Desulforhopalus vacuolatus]